MFLINILKRKIINSSLTFLTVQGGPFI